MNRLVQGIVLATLLALTACGMAVDDDGVADSTRGDQDLRFVGDTDGAPEDCDIATVANDMVEFFAMLNEGGDGIAERFFTDGVTAHFQWFSFTDRESGGPGHFVTYAPDGLNEHFTSRHAAGDRFVLRGAKFIGYNASRSSVGFSPVLFEYHISDADTDSTIDHYGMGKGEYHCETARFTGMSLGATADDSRWFAMLASMDREKGR